MVSVLAFPFPRVPAVSTRVHRELCINNETLSHRTKYTHTHSEPVVGEPEMANAAPRNRQAAAAA